MKEDCITLKFSVPSPVYFHLGDGIDNELGIFELVDMYKPTYNDSTGGYDYELRLDAYYWKWKNKKFFYTPEDGGREASWNLTATLEKHMAAFIKNLNKLGYKFRDLAFEPHIDETVEQSSKLVSYDNCNLIDALTQMAEAWECEWWIENHQIRFGRCEFSDPVDLEFGVNVNKMDRSDGQNKYASRIYAFGSTRNIPKTYRKKLVFDVKKVDGRDISDTERILNNEYFPVSSKSECPIKIIFPEEAVYPFNKPSTFAVQRQNTIIKDLAKGKYEIRIKNLQCYTYLSRTADIGYNLKDNFRVESWIAYDSGAKHNIISLFDFLVPTNNAPIMTKVYLDIKDHKLSFTLNDDATNCEIITQMSVGFNADKTGWVGFCNSEPEIEVGMSNSVDVSFLSGVNVGQTFKADYNPTFLAGNDSNIIRLPEGITASLGDMYTIDNIIKGKVPDKYFSKDDNETTINSVVQKRLMLPVEVPYIDADKGMTQEEAIEEIVVFEDIYAKYIGSITEKPTIRYEFEKDNEDKPTEKKYPIYKIKDANLKNFGEEFVIDKLRLVFQTGTLSGLDFVLDLKTSDDSGTVFEIYRSDDYGRFLPDDVLFPQEKHTENGKEVPADTYILYGFDTAYLSEDMLPKAEEELLKKAQEYVKKSKIDPSTYNCEMNSSWVFSDQLRRTFTVGDKVNLINKAYFDTGRQSRIIGYEFNLDIPYDHPVYTVGETAAYSRIGEIESKIDSLTFKGLTYSGLSVTGGGSSVYVIGVNDKTLPSDRNTFSAKRAFTEFVSKTKDDKAAGHLTLEKGATANDLIQANNGLVVRKQELVEPMIVSLLSKEFEDNIVEEDRDVFIEEMSLNTGGASTLGELGNVVDEADKVSDTDDILIRLASASEWTLNTSLLSNVSQLMTKVFPFTITLSGGGTYEKGSSQTINLSWTYDRDIESQSINNESLLVSLRTKQYIGVTIDTAYNLKVILSGSTYTKSVSAQFKTKKYYGVSADKTLTNAQILSLSSAWSQRTQGSTVFDCTGGKYPYYILPTSMVSGIQFWIGGLRNTDWTEETLEVTNAFGYTENYTIFRLTSIQTGVLNIEIK